jgi:hypothetical protein
VRSANQERVFLALDQSERVILLSSQPKLGKNALFVDQSAFSNFALYVIIRLTGAQTELLVLVFSPQDSEWLPPAAINSFTGETERSLLIL